VTQTHKHTPCHSPLGNLATFHHNGNGNENVADEDVAYADDDGVV